MANNAKPLAAETMLITRFCRENPKSVAQRLEMLSAQEAVEILNRIPAQAAVPVWSELSAQIACEMIENMSQSDAIETLETIDPGKAASILSIIGPTMKDLLISKLDQGLANEIAELITYPIDSAGWLMDTRVLLFTAHMTVSQARKILRARHPKQGLHELHIVDEQKRIQSVVQLNELALAESDQTLETLSQQVTAVVKPTDTREEIIEQMELFGLEELAVIDHEGRILGVIRHSTLIDVIREDVSVDIQTMVGVSKDERASSGSWLAIRKRLPWMQVNLLTAFAAAAVVGIFESTIAKFTALAVLLPIVAGQSGNAGAQALAVTMRGLSLREVRVRDWPKMVRKETVVGFWNGIAIAVVCGIAVYIWSGQFGLVIVITSSMILAMIVAGISGVLVPVGLKQIGQDPAVASSIVLTTITDIAGFFAFLGIATILSGMLV